jgi:hypothetical protein
MLSCSCLRVGGGGRAHIPINHRSSLVFKGARVFDNDRARLIFSNIKLSKEFALRAVFIQICCHSENLLTFAVESVHNIVVAQLNRSEEGLVVNDVHRSRQLTTGRCHFDLEREHEGHATRQFARSHVVKLEFLNVNQTLVDVVKDLDTLNSCLSVTITVRSISNFHHSSKSTELGHHQGELESIRFQVSIGFRIGVSASIGFSIGVSVSVSIEVSIGVSVSISISISVGIDMNVGDVFRVDSVDLNNFTCLVHSNNSNLVVANAILRGPEIQLDFVPIVHLSALIRDVIETQHLRNALSIEESRLCGRNLGLGRLVSCVESNTARVGSMRCGRLNHYVNRVGT